MSDELTPHFMVTDPDGNEVFEVWFYEEGFTHHSGFTFDDPDGNTWICHDLDEENLVICGEPMDDYMNRAITKYYRDQNRDVPDDIEYGIVSS